jgi:uncharacterized membrane protein YdfJ with MMPL/SSD domain
MKSKIFILFVLFFFFYFLVCFAEEKKIRVILEGEEDANTVTAKDIIQTTQKGVYILKTRQQMEAEAKKLREIAEHPKIEGEIIDAIISKIIDIENNQQKQMKIILVLSAIVLLLFLIVILMIVRKK